MEGRLTTREAAALLGVAQRSVTRYVLTGALSAERVWEPDGPYLFDINEVKALAPVIAQARERRHRGLAKAADR